MYGFNSREMEHESDREMINRRGFLQVTGVAGGALLASEITSVHRASAWAMGNDFDKAAAARELAVHRIVKITARQVRDRFPRSIGPNSRGQPVGGGKRTCSIAARSTWRICQRVHRSAISFGGSQAHRRVRARSGHRGFYSLAKADAGID